MGGVSQERSIQAITKDKDCDQALNENTWSLEVFHCYAEKELAPPLKARDYKDPLVVIYER